MDINKYRQLILNKNKTYIMVFIALVAGDKQINISLVSD